MLSWSYPTHCISSGRQGDLGKSDYKFEVLSEKGLLKSFNEKEPRDLFLESPGNFSGPKSQLPNCNLLALKS